MPNGGSGPNRTTAARVFNPSLYLLSYRSGELDGNFEFPTKTKNRSRRRVSNPQQTVYKTVALPVELRRRSSKRGRGRRIRAHAGISAPFAGCEALPRPVTQSLLLKIIYRGNKKPQRFLNQPRPFGGLEGSFRKTFQRSCSGRLTSRILHQ